MEALQSPAEHRVVLPNIEWSTYAKVLDSRGELRSPRLAYDRGSLEIMSPSSEHEAIAYFLSLVVTVYAEERVLDLFPAGAATFTREDLGRGVEPDGCFYTRGARQARERPRIDLEAGDPPPDLVIEVDITSPSLQRLPIYGALGVSEVWRYVGADQGKVQILSLARGGSYERVCESRVLPAVASDGLSEFVRESLGRSFGEVMRRARELVG